MTKEVKEQIREVLRNALTLEETPFRWYVENTSDQVEAIVDAELCHVLSNVNNFGEMLHACGLCIKPIDTSQ
jgi:hypothetical protein